MVDAGTGLTLLAPSALMVKILGPTAEYVGGGVQQWSERRVQNVNKVFAKAARKLGEERLEEPGAVPPKVLKGILDEASFCDDELAAEYLGGALASARSPVSRDDRAVSLVARVTRLSTYQLRSHYVMYHAAQRMLESANLPLGKIEVRRAHGTFFMPGPFWEAAMDFSEEERDRDEFHSIVDHVLEGLSGEGLIDREIMGAGPKAFLQDAFGREFPSDGIMFCISVLGMELFTSAHGVTGRPVERFQGNSSQFKVELPQSLDAEVMDVMDLPAMKDD